MPQRVAKDKRRVEKIWQPPFLNSLVPIKKLAHDGAFIFSSSPSTPGEKKKKLSQISLLRVWRTGDDDAHTRVKKKKKKSSKHKDRQDYSVLMRRASEQKRALNFDYTTWCTGDFSQSSPAIQIGSEVEQR